MGRMEHRREREREKWSNSSGWQPYIQYTGKQTHIYLKHHANQKPMGSTRDLEKWICNVRCSSQIEKAIDGEHVCVLSIFRRPFLLVPMGVLGGCAHWDKMCGSLSIWCGDGESSSSSVHKVVSQCNAMVKQYMRMLYTLLVRPETRPACFAVLSILEHTQTYSHSLTAWTFVYSTNGNPLTTPFAPT